MFDERKANRVTRFIENLKHTKGKFHGQPFKLLPWQKKVIDDVFGTVRDDNPKLRQFSDVYIEIPKKQGKQLALYTKIPTPDGWKEMGELKVGDLVFDEKGLPCHVLALSEIDDTEQCYRITFRDGSCIDAGARHLWNVQNVYGKYYEYQTTTEELYQRTARLRNSKTAGEAERKRSVVRIPVAEPLQTAECELPIDPYVYGFWLGNGNAIKPELTVRTCDVDAVKQSIPYPIKKEYLQQGGGSVVLVIPALKPILVNSFRDKAIRPEYLRASESQRWALLQGLVDSDGSIGENKAQSTYVSTIKPLALSVRELLWSLGIKNAMTESPSMRYGKPTGETLYTIRFTTFEDQPTSRLNRKMDRNRERGKKTRSCFHCIKDIETIDHPVRMRCIQVDSPTHQYLAGESMVPTHNSELGAALALNMLVNDDEYQAEVYSCAADKNQASIVFDVATEMVNQCPALARRIKIIPSTRRMVYLPTGSVYKVLSADVRTKHGLNVSACIFDELHTQPNRDLYDVMTQGSGDAREQPLFFYLTTAGTDRNSICWEVHTKAVDILEGRKKDPYFYPVVFGLGDDEDWTDEKNWYKANPSLGITIDIDKVRKQYARALENPADEAAFRQLRLNQWIKSTTRWINMSYWDRCEQDFTENTLAGRECYAGLDLSSTSDLTAFVLVFPPDADDPDGLWYVLAYYWCPESQIELRTRRDHVPYKEWVAYKYIEATEGNVVDYKAIRKKINELYEKFNIKEIAYDRWNATMLVQQLQDDDGITMVEFGQGYKSMSPPTKDLEIKVPAGKIAHNGNPILRWNIDNVAIQRDPADNHKIDKAKSTEKVDGAVALAMALGRAMVHVDQTSVYDKDDHDLIVF